MRTREDKVRTNGVEIAYDTFGDSSYPPMILIMGLSSQMIMWEDEFCERLARKGFWVVRFDNRDVGRSTQCHHLGLPDFKSVMKGKAPGVPYTLEDMANDTIGFMDSLSIDSAHIVGASMGGMIGQEMAMRYPQRVCTLTAIMSTTGNPLLPPPRPEVARFLFRPFPTDREAYIEYFVEMWNMLNGGEIPFDGERVRRLGELSYERGVSPAGSARQLAAVYFSGSRKERLASIDVPVLVIHGDIDPLLQLPCGIDIAESIPGAKQKIIPGMGHALPPAVWDEVIDAVTGHVQSSGEECRVMEKRRTP